MIGTSELETVFLVSGLVAAWAGTIVAAMHGFGILPSRYKRQLASIQATTAEAIGISIKAAINELAAKQDPAEMQAQSQAMIAAIAQGVAQATQAGLDPLASRLEGSVGQIADRTEKALRDGLGALADTIVGIQASSAGQQLGASSGIARGEKSLAKVGARRLLAQYANQAGTIPGAVASGAMAFGLVDDDSVVKAAEWLLENPEIAQKLQNSFNALREKRGLVGTGAYSPGIKR